MCGIYAQFFNSEINVDRLTQERIFNSMEHRGPDMKGLFIDSNNGIYMAHKRLSIVDLTSCGIQPMSIDGGEFTIIFNGEIYNFEELLNDEALKEVCFFSRTDTEVLLYLYKFYGESFVEKLNGMWAFAILDKNSSKVFISRDRVGAKPLYYYSSEKGLIISSEIKTIIASGNYEVNMDFSALNEYFTFQNIISDKTLFDGIRILSPGHNIIFSLKDFYLSINEYWDLKL